MSAHVVEREIIAHPQRPMVRADDLLVKLDDGTIAALAEGRCCRRRAAGHAGEPGCRAPAPGGVIAQAAARGLGLGGGQ